MATYNFRDNFKATLTIPQTNLSQLLSLAPKFSFFDELINIPQPGSKLSNHDIYRSGKLLQDIQVYLIELVKILKLVSQTSNEPGKRNILDWYFEGKEELVDLLRNVDSIESILNQLILVFESGENNEVSIDLMGSFDIANDVLLEAKKHMILLKRNLDIAINYQEINQGIIKSLITEIEDCIKNIFKLREIKLSSPKRVLPKFNLNDITRKMKINDCTNSLSIKMIRLPTFNDIDEKLYSKFLEIECKTDPLRMSLNIVPVKIDEFNTICKGNFKTAREEVLTNYESMNEKWNYLQRELTSIKHEVIDLKWNEIFKYLIEEIEEQCDYMIEEIGNSRCSSLSSSSSTGSSLVTEEIAGTYKQCSNTIAMITKAFTEGIITEEKLAGLFNNNLLPKWKQICDLLEDTKSSRHKSMPIFKVPTTGLKSFRTGSRHSYDGTIKNGLRGIDIGLDVEQTVSVPFSVEKPERVKSFIDSTVPGKNLSDELKNVFDEYSSPKLDITAFFDNILSSTTPFKSRIPRIMPNYHELGYPIINKKINPGSKIPEINFTHPVFNSPERGGARDRYGFTSPVRIRTGSSSMSTLSSTKYSLLALDKPNLAFEKFSTPERPSSFGSSLDGVLLSKPHT